MRIRFGAHWILRHDTAMRQHAVNDLAMSGGINHIDAASKDTHCSKVALDGSLVRVDIDAIGESANYQWVARQEFLD
jgi:hypothetical protein